MKYLLLIIIFVVGCTKRPLYKASIHCRIGYVKAWNDVLDIRPDGIQAFNKKFQDVDALRRRMETVCGSLDD